ncbi:unnamed protein product, partial [Allacma fusca]
RYDDQLLPAFIEAGGNPLLDPANEIDPDDFGDQPAILNFNNDRPDHHVVEVEMNQFAPDLVEVDEAEPAADDQGRGGANPHPGRAPLPRMAKDTAIAKLRQMFRR